MTNLKYKLLILLSVILVALSIATPCFAEDTTSSVSETTQAAETTTQVTDNSVPTDFDTFARTTYDFYTWVLGILIFFCVCIFIKASYKLLDRLFT